MVFLATLGGIGALLFWGVSDYYAGKSGQTISAESANLILQSAAVIIATPLLIFDSTPWEFSWSLSVIAIIALLFTIAYISFIRALALGPVGIAAPLSNSYSVITIVVTTIFLGVSIASAQIVSLFMISIGAIMLAFDKKTLRPENINRRTILLSLLTAVSWGIGFALMDIVTATYSWQQLLFLISAFMVMYALALHVIKYQHVPSPKKLIGLKTKSAWVAGVLMGFGTVFFYLSLEFSTTVAVPAVIAAGSPLVTSFMSHQIDGEKLTLYKRIGAVLIIGGVMLLNL